MGGAWSTAAASVDPSRAATSKLSLRGAKRQGHRGFAKGRATPEGLFARAGSAANEARQGRGVVEREAAERADSGGREQDAAHEACVGEARVEFGGWRGRTPAEVELECVPASTRGNSPPHAHTNGAGGDPDPREKG